MTDKILIASSTNNSQEYQPVAEGLQKIGYEVITYNSDAVLNGAEKFLLSVSDSGNLCVEYEDIDISPSHILAAWYRKVSDFIKDRDQIKEKATQLLFQSEVDDFHDTIWTQYPDNLWLNSPAIMFGAAQKISQLRIAQKVGFEIPQTTISNNWQRIVETINDSNQDDDIIVKMIRGVLIEDDTEKAFACTKLSPEIIKTISDISIPFPGIYQPFIDKGREWRVTVVGEDVFPVAIYTEEKAKDDWRKHQMTGAVRFKAETLPTELSSRCTDYLDNMSLKFGAFDFVERNDGSIVFLECNTNGQYYWFEKTLGLKISDSIVSMLHRIAINNKK